MITWAVDHYALDSDRVFIAGMSSGGLLAGVMLATYPEVFAAGAMQSAYPYKCANSYDELKPCSQAERSLSAAAWGAMVTDAHPGYAGARPRVSIWHGEADTLILPDNLERQMEQWTSAAGVDRKADEVDSIAGHVRRRFDGPDGEPAVETWMVGGMGHAVAIDPDGTPACGIAAPFFVDADLCAALWIARWFGIAR
jgi:poly(3-hydroxybutyrate) depolymerase